MLTQLIEYFMQAALMHKAVNHARYQSRILHNAQNSNGYMQFYIEDNPSFDLLISVPNRPFTFTVNIDILAWPNKDYTVLDAQDDALTVAVEWLHYIQNQNPFPGQLSVRDYSLLALSHFTDDDAAGQRLTVEFIIPDPINLCTYMDNFSEDYVPEVVTDDIDLKEVGTPGYDNELVLRPILLKQNT